MMNIPAEIWRKHIEMGSSAEPMVTADASESGKGSRSHVWVLAALLGLATLGVYASTTRNAFVDFDDRDYVTLNDHVKAGLSWQNIAWAFRSMEAANWHPLTWISHMADCKIFALNPAGHHAVSATLHAMNAVLLFLLLEKATGLRSRSLGVAALASVERRDGGVDLRTKKSAEHAVFAAGCGLLRMVCAYGRFRARAKVATITCCRGLLRAGVAFKADGSDVACGFLIARLLAT